MKRLFILLLFIIILFSCKAKVDKNNHIPNFIRIMYYSDGKYESAIIDLKTYKTLKESLAYEELKNYYILIIDEKGFYGIPFSIYDEIDNNSYYEYWPIEIEQ